MAFEITPVDVWAGELEDRPGALASKLAKIIMIAEADLEFVLLRPLCEKPGRAVLFLAPLIGPEQTQAAEDAGLHKCDSMHVLRLVGPDRRGLAAGIAGELEHADVDVAGLTAAATHGNVVIYIRFATAEDVAAAAKVLGPKLG